MRSISKTILIGSLGLVSLGAQAPPAAPPANQAAPANQATPANQAAQPKWKDGQTEYNMFAAAKNETDAKKKLALINAWKEKYPETEFKLVRLQLYLNAYQQLNDIPKLLATLNEMMALDPKDLTVMSPFMYYTMASNDTTPEALDKANKVANAALANLDNKPASVSDEQWPQAKKQIEALAHKTLGWTAMQSKKWDVAEQEFGKSLQIDPNQGEVDYWLGNSLRAAKTPEKISQALFYYARAATYDGPGSLTPQGRQQLDDYLRKAYNSYHGQDDAGLNQLKTMAKSQAAPPPDFKIKTANEIAVEKEEEFKKTNPELALWMGVKKMLTGPEGKQYFDSQMKGAAVPALKGKLISAKPAVHSKELVVGVADPNTPEVTLKLDTPLKGKPEIGDEFEFEGVPTAFDPDPFMVTFNVETSKIKGLNIKAAPAAAPRRRPVAKKKG
jgi:tetratricopeptide (TPR) repeat protein